MADEQPKAATKYAVVTDGSRQYRASVGESFNIDHREVELGATIDLDQVLLVAGDGAPKVGTPTVAGAKVVAEVIGFPKVKTVAQYFRRRKNSQRLRGHTQPHVRVKVKEIVG
jgi:large subunit ribosomal protein L21